MLLSACPSWVVPRGEDDALFDFFKSHNLEDLADLKIFAARKPAG